VRDRVVTVTHPAVLRRFAGSQVSASRQVQCRPTD